MSRKLRNTALSRFEATRNTLYFGIWMRMHAIPHVWYDDLWPDSRDVSLEEGMEMEMQNMTGSQNQGRYMVLKSVWVFVGVQGVRELWA